jgi:hypothetical protein
MIKKIREGALLPVYVMAQFSEVFLGITFSGVSQRTACHGKVHILKSNTT